MRDEISHFVAGIANEESQHGPLGGQGEARPRIYLPSGPTEICESARHIYSLMRDRRTGFYRGGRVHEVLVGSDGKARLAVITPEAMRSRIEKLGETWAYVKNNNGGYNLTRKRPSTADCEALLAAKEAEELLLPIAHVCSAPIIVFAGGALKTLSKGYNPECGGVFVTCGDHVPTVPFDEATSALEVLLSDFQFATESDKTRALSTMVSPALLTGGLLGGRCPLHLNEADQSQTGKGYNLEIVAAIYGERPMPVMKRAGGVGSFDESLSQRLVAGCFMIVLDNLRGKLDSQFLEGVLTAPGEVGLRLPHCGEVFVDPRRYFFAATSNGIETTTDMANRSCIVRLRKQPVGFEFAKYPEGELLEHVRARHLYYLGCIHAVIRAWWEAGAPRLDASRHDFRQWATTVGGLIKFAWPDAAPLMDGHAAAQTRAASKWEVFVRAVCLAIVADESLDRPVTASAIAELCNVHGIDIPGLTAGATDEAARKQVGIAMARVLKGDHLRIDEYEVARKECPQQRTDGHGGSFTIKQYVFRRTHTAPPAEGPK